MMRVLAIVGAVLAREDRRSRPTTEHEHRDGDQGAALLLRRRRHRLRGAGRAGERRIEAEPLDPGPSRQPARAGSGRYFRRTDHAARRPEMGMLELAPPLSFITSIALACALRRRAARARRRAPRRSGSAAPVFSRQRATTRRTPVDADRAASGSSITTLTASSVIVCADERQLAGRRLVRGSRRAPRCRCARRRRCADRSCSGDM